MIHFYLHDREMSAAKHGQSFESMESLQKCTKTLGKDIFKRQFLKPLRPLFISSFNFRFPKKRGNEVFTNFNHDDFL